MELGHLPDREVTADVRVEDKEGSGIASQYLVSEMIDSARCSQRSILLQVPGGTLDLRYPYPIQNATLLLLLQFSIVSCISIAQ